MTLVQSVHLDLSKRQQYVCELQRVSGEITKTARKEGKSKKYCLLNGVRNGEYYLQFDDLIISLQTKDVLESSRNPTLFRLCGSETKESNDINVSSGMELNVSGTKSKCITNRLIESYAKLLSQNLKGRPRRRARILKNRLDCGIFGNRLLPQASQLRRNTIKQLSKPPTLIFPLYDLTF